MINYYLNEEKMTEASKEDLLAFLDRMDAVADEMENHPQLMVYYIGIVEQMRNCNTAARTNLGSS